MCGKKPKFADPENMYFDQNNEKAEKKVFQNLRISWNSISNYDHNKVGWQYTSEKNAKGKWTYDTSLPGYSNTGHYYGDHLTSNERMALIEYLKTI